MLRKLIGLAVCLLALASLTGCGKKLPDVPDRDKILTDLPKELTTVTLDGTDYALEAVDVQINSRDTDLEHQVDNVNCTVSLSGDGMTSEYTCQLDYAYVRESGWTIRDYSFLEEPALTVDPNANSVMSALQEAGEETVREELGYEDVSYHDGEWTEQNNSYTLRYTVGTGNKYLAIDGTVEVDGGLVYSGSGMKWSWTSQLNEDSVRKTVTLTGTVWHLLQEETQYEMAFQVTAAGDETITITGIVHSPSVTGQIIENTIDCTEDWTVSEYGTISFTVYAVDQRLTVNISNDEQWVDSVDGVEIGQLENTSMPDSGSLEDLMSLKVEKDSSFTWPWEKWFGKDDSADSTDNADAGDTGDSGESSAEETAPANSGSFFDYISDFFKIFT